MTFDLGWQSQRGLGLAVSTLQAGTFTFVPVCLKEFSLAQLERMETLQYQRHKKMHKIELLFTRNRLYTWNNASGFH